MGKEFQYAGTVDSNRPFRLKVGYCFWPFLRSDQWFLPRFYLELENLGKELSRNSFRKQNYQSEGIREIEKLSIDQLQQQGINPYQRPVGQFKGKQVFDLRFTEILKIHSLSSVSTIYGMFIGSILAIFASGLYTIVKLVNSHWDKLLELLKIT